MIEYLELTKNLIQIPSVSSDQSAVLLCQDLIKNYLGRNFICQKVKSGKYISYILSEKKIKNFDVLFYAHLDVVPADKQSFIPKIKNNRLYGRGSLDMKSAAAIQSDILKNTNYKNLKIGLVLVPDEEIGGENGFQKVLSAGFRAKLVIVPDGGMGKKIIISQKGVLFYKLTKKGKGGHGSRPWLAQNPILELIKVYQVLVKDLKINNKKVNQGITANLGKIIGGEKTNAIPYQAEITVDFRYSTKSQQNQLEKYLSSLKNIKVEKIFKGEIFQISKNNNFLKKFQQITKVDFDWETGGSDARFLTKYNIPAIIYQPRGDNHHSENEWVSIDSLAEFKEQLLKYLQYLDQHYEKFFKKNK